MAIIMPAPGMMPIMLPMTVDCAQVGSSSLHSFQLGNSTLVILFFCSFRAAIISLPWKLSNNSIMEVIPNRPISMGTREIPSCRYMLPKVKRAEPVWGSMPIQPISRPKAMAMMLLPTFSPAIPTTEAKPRTVSMKYSGGPKRRDCCARKGHRVRSTMADTMPPTQLDMVAIPRALPARPCCAMG